MHLSSWVILLSRIFGVVTFGVCGVFLIRILELKVSCHSDAALGVSSASSSPSVEQFKLSSGGMMADTVLWAG